MSLLLLAGLLWAFSFSIIKHQLAGIDPQILAFLRLLLATLFFLPFLRLGGLQSKKLFWLGLVGGIQFGLMYVFYLFSFRYLTASEVAIFTIFTPFWILIFSSLFRKSFRLKEFLLVLLVIGATFLLIFSQTKDYNFQSKGIVLLQLSNISFAFGVVLYKRVLSAQLLRRQKSIFGLLYASATLVALMFILFSGKPLNLKFTMDQWLFIIYLGIIPSGLAFFLFNIGATKSSDLQVAVANNLKIPLAVILALIFFQERINLLSVLIGTFIYALSIFLAFRGGQNEY